MKILKFEADVCPQCKALDFILMATPDINELVEKINIDRDENKQYIEQYNLMGTPTMIVLDDDGIELGRIVGVKGMTPEILREKVNSL